MTFKVGDLVVVKVPPTPDWDDICCKIIDSNVNPPDFIVDNGRGKRQVFTENQLQHLCDAVHEYVLSQIALNPEIRKKTIFVVDGESRKQ